MELLGSSRRRYNASQWMNNISAAREATKTHRQLT